MLPAIEWPAAGSLDAAPVKDITAGAQAAISLTAGGTAPLVGAQQGSRSVASSLQSKREQGSACGDNNVLLAIQRVRHG